MWRMRKRLSRRQRPARRAALRRRITRRAGLLFVVGLACGALGTPVAVILGHYALLFLLALPLLGLRAPALGAIAGAWLVLGPVAVFAASTAGQALLGRDEFLLDARLWLSPMPEDLLTPGVLLADLVVTGAALHAHRLGVQPVRTILEDAAADLRGKGGGGGTEDIDKRAARAGLGLEGAKDHGRNTGSLQGAGAHGAGF